MTKRTVQTDTESLFCRRIRQDLEHMRKSGLATAPVLSKKDAKWVADTAALRWRLFNEQETKQRRRVVD